MNVQSPRKYSIISLAVFGIVYYGLILFVPRHAVFISDTLSPMGSLLALGLIGWSYKWQSVKNKKLWLFFGLSVLGFLLGDLSWFYYEIGLKREVPFPSICDVFYTLSTVFSFAATIVFLNIKNVYATARAIFDIVITMVVAATLSWIYITSPIYMDSSLTPLSKVFSLVYPVSDLGFLFGALSIFFLSSRSSVKNKTAGKLILATFCIWFITDQIYSFETNLGIYSAGNWIDPLWPLSTGLLGIASLWTAEFNTNSIEEDSNPPVTSITPGYRGPFRVFLPYLGFVVLIILVSIKYVAQDPLVAGAVIVAFLIIVRQVFTLIENQRLTALLAQSNKTLSENQQLLESKNTELIEQNLFKEKEARTDFLTGLYNRRYVDYELKKLKAEAIRTNQPLSMLLIDVDYFKEVNDLWGHDAGDQVLQRVAELIQGNVRSADVIGRMGGDEFVVVLPDADIDLAITIGERLCHQIANEDFSYGESVKAITVSIGGSQLMNSETDDASQFMFIRADRALYAAKKRGRNCMMIA